jgi:Cutinase
MPTLRRLRRPLVLGLIVALLAAFAALAHAGAAPGQQAATTCPRVAVLASRGSGDPLDRRTKMSAPGQLFYGTLAKLVPGTQPWANPYHAVGVWSWNLKKIGPELLNGLGAGTKLSGLGLGAYNGSVVGGSKMLTQHIRHLAASCALNTTIVLVGYSQGAQVTADVYQRDLTNVERQMVAAVVLFGDPYFNRHDKTADRGSYSGRRGGILGQRPIFGEGPLVLSYCHSHDPICQGVGERIGPNVVLDPGAFTFRQHTNYTKHGEPQQAARLVAAVPEVRGPDATLAAPIYPSGVLRQLRVFHGPVLVPTLIPRKWPPTTLLAWLEYESEQPNSPISPVTPRADYYSIAWPFPAPDAPHSVHAGGGGLDGSAPSPDDCKADHAPGTRCPAFTIDGLKVDFTTGSGGGFYSWRECHHDYDINDGSATPIVEIKATIKSLRVLPGTGSCRAP